MRCAEVGEGGGVGAGVEVERRLVAHPQSCLERVPGVVLAVGRRRGAAREGAQVPRVAVLQAAGTEAHRDGKIGRGDVETRLVDRREHRHRIAAGIQAVSLRRGADVDREAERPGCELVAERLHDDGGGGVGGARPVGERGGVPAVVRDREGDRPGGPARLRGPGVLVGGRAGVGRDGGDVGDVAGERSFGIGRLHPAVGGHGAGNAGGEVVRVGNGGVGRRGAECRDGGGDGRMAGGGRHGESSCLHHFRIRNVPGNGTGPGVRSKTRPGSAAAPG